MHFFPISAAEFMKMVATARGGTMLITALGTARQMGKVPLMAEIESEKSMPQTLN